MIILNIVILIIGFIVLIKGADLFVDGASGVALNFKVSKMLIGLTIVAFGTSAPEFAVSVKSLLSGSGEIVLGDTIGSNILNILLILGTASLFHSLNVKNNTVKKELPIMMLLSTLFSVLLFDNVFNGTENTFTRSDGIVLVLFFLVFLYYLISMMRKKVDVNQDVEDKNLSLPKSCLFTIVGIVGIILGSNLVVESASSIATALGVTERMIALTIISLGTSLPELVTSVTATRKGEYDIAIGNVVGSNIFNICMVTGVPVALLGGISNYTTSIVDVLVMIAASVLLFAFSFKDKKIGKREGLIFLTIFVCYYSYVVFGNM